MSQKGKERAHTSQNAVGDQCHGKTHRRLLCTASEQWFILLSVCPALTGSDSLRSQTGIFASPAWKCQGLNWGLFACKARTLSLSFGPS